jgi:methanogenic corrinoid protein MtbC1
VTFLGADTPIADLTHTIEAAQPDLVVLAATVPERFESIVDDLATMGRDRPLAIAGAGATTDVAQRTFARLLAGDPVTAAEAEADRVSGASRPRRRAAAVTSQPVVFPTDRWNYS